MQEDLPCQRNRILGVDRTVQVYLLTGKVRELRGSCTAAQEADLAVNIDNAVCSGIYSDTVLPATILTTRNTVCGDNASVRRYRPVVSLEDVSLEDGSAVYVDALL
jgi:hypothetical protein